MDFRAHACFEQALGSLDVVDGVDGEIAAPAPPHSRLRRQVEDPVHAVQQPAEGRILDAGFDEGEAGVCEQPCQVRFLERPRVVVGEAVDADHLGALREQPISQVRPDEPRNAGDQRLHRFALSLRVLFAPRGIRCVGSRVIFL